VRLSERSSICPFLLYSIASHIIAVNPYSPNPCNWAVTINRLPHFPPPSHLPYHHNTADIISFFFYNISPVAQWKNYGVALKPKAKHYVSEASSNTLCSKPPKLRLRSSGSPCLLTISQTLHLRPAVCSSQAPQSMYPAPSAAMSGPGPIYKLRSMMHTEHPVHRFNEKKPTLYSCTPETETTVPNTNAKKTRIQRSSNNIHNPITLPSYHSNTIRRNLKLKIS